jgi:hypothetical protein
MTVLRPAIAAVVAAGALVLGAAAPASASALGAATPTAPLGASAEGPPPVEVATGLDNPRGLAFGPDGALYVAEAGVGGSGPCQKAASGRKLCFGRTGAITRIAGGMARRVIQQLPSLAFPAGTKATGPSDVTVDAKGNLSYTIGLGGSPDARTAIPPLAGMAKLYGPPAVVDIGGYEKQANPDRVQPPETNPNAVLADGADRYVVDAGGRALLRVDDKGRVSTVAVFPTRTVSTAKGPLKVSSVPSAVVKGPDGAFYVSELTGSPSAPGQARIYRVVPGRAPQVYAAGLTDVIDLAFGPGPALYVLEVARLGLDSGDRTGALLRINPKGAPTTIEVRNLKSPSGLAVRGSDAYITRCGICNGGGSVVRVPLS